jgi:hypothetical protein
MLANLRHLRPCYRSSLQRDQQIAYWDIFIGIGWQEGLPSIAGDLHFIALREDWYDGGRRWEIGLQAL